MNLQRDLAVFFVFLVMILFFGTQSHGQTCELDFHTDSSSVMLLPGDNVSILCDAVCYGRDSGVHVVWRDAFRRQIGSQPSGVFSVQYNHGLMNRIIMINGSQSVAGTYICSAERNGEVLQHKPMDFIILGSNGNVDTRPAQEEGPRRGDITPDRDIEYRPVRSVDRALSRVDTRHQSPDHIVKQNGHHLGETREKNSVEQNRQESQVLDEGSYLSRLYEEGSQIYNRNNKLFNSINGLQSEKNLAQEADNKVKIGITSEMKNLKLLLRILDLKLKKSDDVILAQNVKGEAKGVSTSGQNHNGNPSNSGYLRVRRQATDATAGPESTTTSEDTSPIGVESNDTTATEIQTQPSDIPSTGMPDTSDGLGTTQRARILITTATVKPSDTPETDDGSANSQCSAVPSNFGKYGVLAFSVTLAVAFLLLYAILMIIFMPKIMARRKEKSDIEGGAYRRTGPDTSDTAPLTILDDPGATDKEDAKQDTTDVDNPGVQADKAEAVDKEEDSAESAAKVSTFLLRQNSERSTGNSTTEKETKDALQATDKEDKSPQSDPITAVVSPSESNHSDKPSTTPLANDVHQESNNTQQLGDFLGDFRMSDFIVSKSAGQSDVANSNEGKTEAAISGTGAGHSGDIGVDLLPSPPPDPTEV